MTPGPYYIHNVTQRQLNLTRDYGAPFFWTGTRTRYKCHSNDKFTQDPTHHIKFCIRISQNKNESIQRYHEPIAPRSTD